MWVGGRQAFTGWICVCVDLCLCGWMDGWMDGWMGSMYLHIYMPLPPLTPLPPPPLAINTHTHSSLDSSITPHHLPGDEWAAFLANYVRPPCRTCEAPDGALRSDFQSCAVVVVAAAAFATAFVVAFATACVCMCMSACVCACEAPVGALRSVLLPPVYMSVWRSCGQFCCCCRCSHACM